MSEERPGTDLPRFVRPIGVVSSHDDTDEAADEDPAVLSPFDGVLGLGVTAGDWPVPALQHLTLTPLVAQSLGGTGSSDDPGGRARDHSDRGVELTSLDAQDTPQPTGATGKTSIDAAESHDEPRVREVIREAGRAERAASHDGVPDDTSGDESQADDSSGEAGTATTGNLATTRFSEPDRPRMDVPESGDGEAPAPGDHSPAPPGERTTQEIGTPGTDTPDGPAPDAPTDDNGRPPEEEAPANAPEDRRGSDATRVRESGRPSAPERPNDPSTSPSMTVQSAGDGANSRSPTRIGRSATQSAVETATPGGTGFDPVTRPGTDSGPFDDAVSMAPLDGGPTGGPQGEGGGANTSGPSGSPADSATGAGDRHGPRMTVRRDGPDGGQEASDGDAASENTAGPADQPGGGSSWTTGSQHRATEFDEAALTEAIDVDRLTERLSDRLYREIEKKQRIERERRGL